MSQPNGLPLRARALVRIFRMIPPIKGKARLARRLLRSDLESSSEVLVTDRYGCRFIVPAPMEPIAFHLLINGAYEGDQVEFIREALEPSSVFVDVGAGIGTYTIPVGQTVPDGRVLAIEPSPRNVAYLRHNVGLNDLHNVRVCQCGVSDGAASEASFYEAPARHFGMSAFVARPWIKLAASVVSVELRTLDDVLHEEGIDRVDVVKVDVEGMEAKVFSGAGRLLDGPDPPLIVFEFMDSAERCVFGRCGESQKVLRDWGYTIWHFRDLLLGRPPLRKVLTEGSTTFVAAAGEELRSFGAHT